MDELVKIAEKLKRARAKLLAAVDSLDEEAWEWPPGEGRWSVRLTLAHVGSAQWSHLEVARRLIAGQSLDLPGFDLDAWNTAQVAKRAHWPVARVLPDLQAAQQATLAFLDELDAEKLVLTGPHPALGQVSVGQLLRIIALHDNLHRRDVVSLVRERAGGA